MKKGAPQVYTKPFGTYTVPGGFYENKVFSTAEKFFYYPDGVLQRIHADNFSVECGECPYTLAQVADFRRAILNVLAVQSQESYADKHYKIVGGQLADTPGGHPLLLYQALEQEVPVDVQYYIVGEKKYIMVHLTRINGKHFEAVEKAAQSVAASFAWAE